MLWLFRFISGFLIIRLSGDYAEKIINKANFSGITLWNLRFKKQTITGCISIRDFKRLPSIHKGTAVKIKILKKSGLPFLIYKYRNRTAFFVGAVIFFALLELLSSFVWTVEVSGNSTVPDSKIIENCRKIGVCEGVFKNKIDAKPDAQELLLNTPELAWAAFNIEGCKVTVDVTEVKNPVLQDEGLPSNLVSTCEGVVEKIDVTSGNVLVKVGDSVAKGEVLVSGIIESLNSTVFVASSGSVIARINETVSEEGTFNSTVFLNTQKSKKRRVIEIYGLKIPLYIGKEKGSFNTKTENSQLEILGKKLPFRLYTKIYNFTQKQTVRYSEEELKEKLRDKIKARLKRSGREDFEITAERIKTTDKGIALEQDISAVINIAEEKKITVKQ